MAAVGGVNEFAVGGDFDIGAGVFCAIESGGEGGGGLDGDEFAGLGGALVGGDAVAFFVIEINDGQLGMKGEVAGLKAGRGAGGGGIVGDELAGGGVEAELIDSIRAGVRHEGKLVGGIGKDRVGAALGFDAAERSFFYRAILGDGMGTDHAAAVAGP